MAKDIILQLDRKQAALIMWLVGQVDWTSPIGYVAEAVFVTLADQGLSIADFTSGPVVTDVTGETLQVDQWTTLSIGGQPYRCQCGCNVFKELGPAGGSDGKQLAYRCNACMDTFVGEPNGPKLYEGDADRPGKE